MATYEFNNKIKFMLPAGYLFSRKEDDEGNEVVNITADEYENDEGETCYKFSCRVSYTEYDPEEADEEFTNDNLLDLLAERMEDSRRLKLPETPKTILINKGMPLSIFGHVMKMFASIVLVQVSDWSVLQLITTGRFDDDDLQANSERYEYLYDVLKATRINGKKLPVDSTSPSQIEGALQLTFDEDGEAIDVSPKIQFNFTNGDETTTYEYTTDGMEEVGKEHFTRVTPDEELYPHYNSVRSAGGLGFLGASVVVNASGTEYKFIPFRNAAENDEAEEDMKALYNRVIAKDTESYNLHEKAKEMQKLFHVNESAFDPRHDRECELEEGYMHRAYMMSGLRSFAWTLADYCKQHDCSPEDIDNTVASRIANFVANEDWLNYDGDTYCQGLCAGSDLHVYFVPDGVTQTDKKKLLPSKEDKDRVKRMKEKFPSYREILSEVHSLNALRKDLEYIYPAVKALWNSLEGKRDYDEALLGNEADIVYAWCALALAAKEPFFTEDGPMSCFFSQPVDKAAQQVRWEAEEAERAEEAAEEWMRKYEKYLEDDPVINFNGSIFVFSGLAGHWAEKDHPTVQKVIEKGGQYRSKVSSLTNYLVVNPGYAGQSKIVAVMEQLQKGKNIKVVLLEDLEKALEGKTSSKKTEWLNNITYLGEESTITTKRNTSAKESTSTRSKPHSEQKATNNGYLFPTYDVNDARQKILKKNRQKGRKPGQCDLCLTIPDDELSQNETAVKQFWYTCNLYSEDYAVHVTELQKMATDISRIFADDSVIPRRDLELYAGNIHDIFSYHALRSFVWTSRTWCKKNKKLLSDFTLEDSLALSRFIAERDGLNYNKIDDKSPQIGSGLLASMHEVDIVVQNPKGFLDIPRDIFHSAAPGDANIFRVVEDLWAYRNIMMDAKEHLQGKNPKALSEAENILREIVAAWCAYVFACRSPYFYVRPAVATSVKIEEIPAWTAPKVETTLVDGKFETIDNVLVACHQTSGTVNIPEGIIDNMTPWNTSFDGMGNGNQIEKVIYPRSYHGQINFGIGVKSVECKGTATKVWAIWVPEHIPCTEYISIEKSLPDIGIHLSYAEHISEIILPEGLETIDLNSLPNGTKRISFPESLKKVEQSFSIFFGEKLEKVEVPKTCPALNEIRKYLASINKEYTLSITVSRQERRMESLKNDLIRASNADRALQIIDDNRECLSDETIRSALANRASKLASRLSSIVARWSGISASAESIAERISDVLNSEYDEQSWQRCWEMGESLMGSYVVNPIRSKLTNEADPITTFRELPMRLAEYIVEQYRESCVKHELYAKISKLQALALEPIAIQNDGCPTRAVFAESLKRQITSLQIDRQFFERLMNYSTDPTVRRFLTTIVKTTSPQNAEDIIYRLTEDRMAQYDQAVSQFRYTSTCRLITEYLKTSILPADGNLPDKDIYRGSVAHDIEAFNIDSSFVEELRKNWRSRTICIFDNVVCSISRDNVNAYVNAIIDRKMDQYNRVATAVNALNNSKTELAREKEALENELSHLGIFAGKRKREIRALLEAMPEKEATLISQGTQAIADADSAAI